MRKILFRGKRVDNGGWVEGIYVNKQHIGILMLYDINLIKVDPFTVGQYTGLDDANGKPIFEGDILKPAGWRCGEIMWSPYACKFVIIARGENGNEDGFELDGEEAENCKVIGNIHDNPELLEVNHD